MIGVEGAPDWCQRGGRAPNEAPQTTAGSAVGGFAAGGPSEPELMPALTLRATPTTHGTNGRTLPPSGRVSRPTVTPRRRREVPGLRQCSGMTPERTAIHAAR